MFNDEDWRRRVEELRPQVEADQSAWRDTVDFRYGCFLVRRSVNVLMCLESAMTNIDAAPDRSRALAHLDAQILGATRSLAAATSLINGQVSVKDPVTCEVIVRIFDSARGAQNGSDAG